MNCTGCERLKEVGGFEKQRQKIVSGGHVCASSLSAAMCLCVCSLMSLHSDSSSIGIYRRGELTCDSLQLSIALVKLP